MTRVAHAARWNDLPRATDSALATRTRERFAAVHDLLGEDVSLPKLARLLAWSLNTVKR